MKPYLIPSLKLAIPFFGFALFHIVCPPLFAAAKLIDRTVVVINDEPILDSDIDAFQKKLRTKSFQELFGGIDPSVIENRSSVLQLLVEERLVNQHVKKLELSATDQEVDGQIKAITKRNGITQAQLVERLKQLGSTFDEYRDGLKRQIERRNLIEREIKPSLELTEEQLRHFYQRNAKPEQTESEYKVAHILLALKAKGPAAVDDADKRAKKVWGEVSKTPSDFEKFVKEYSDDNSTPDGSLGFFSPSSLAKEFRAVVIKTPVGQVTKPIKMADGFHILKVLEVRAPDFSTLPKEQREALRMQMLSSETEKKMALWLERRKHEANIRVVADAPKDTK